MSKYHRIHTITNRLKQKFATCNPFTLAQDLNIYLYREPLGSLLGFFAIVEKRYCLFYNEELDYPLAKEVVAHELGHCILHRQNIADFNKLQEITFFNLTAETEIEANLFAAELLISDQQIKDFFDLHYSDEQMANELAVSLDLLLYKLISMRKRLGIPINIRYQPTSNFLTQIRH